MDNLSTGRLENILKFKSQIKFIKCDISKKGKWMEEFKGQYYVFHLAALADIVPSIQSPKKYFESNVTGTLNVLEASRKVKLKKFYILLHHRVMEFPLGTPQVKTKKSIQNIHTL